MPAKKMAKPVQAKGSEAEDMIEEYLKSQYKPFAVNDIVQNLHNKVGKAAAVKALESLASAGRVTTKSFGKIVIYSCNEQELLLPEGLEPAKFTPETLTQLRAELAEVEKDRCAASEVLAKTMKEPSNGELQKLIELNRNTVQGLRDGLDRLQSDWEPSDEIVIQKITLAEATLEKEMKKRRKMVKNLIALLKETVRPSNMAEFLVCMNKIKSRDSLKLKFTNYSLLSKENIGFEEISE